MPPRLVYMQIVMLQQWWSQLTTEFSEHIPHPSTSSDYILNWRQRTQVLWLNTPPVWPCEHSQVCQAVPLLFPNLILSFFPLTKESSQRSSLFAIGQLTCTYTHYTLSSHVLSRDSGLLFTLSEANPTTRTLLCLSAVATYLSSLIFSPSLPSLFPPFLLDLSH
jgi:hypothetical protein